MKKFTVQGLDTLNKNVNDYIEMLYKIDDAYKTISANLDITKFMNYK